MRRVVGRRRLRRRTDGKYGTPAVLQEGVRSRSAAHIYCVAVADDDVPSEHGQSPSHTVTDKTKSWSISPTIRDVSMEVAENCCMCTRDVLALAITLVTVVQQHHLQIACAMEQRIGK